MQVVARLAGKLSATPVACCHVGDANGRRELCASCDVGGFAWIRGGRKVGFGGRRYPSGPAWTSQAGSNLVLDARVASRKTQCQRERSIS